MASTSSESEVDHVAKRLRDSIKDYAEVSRELQAKNKELDIWKSIYSRDMSRLHFRIGELEQELLVSKMSILDFVKRKMRLLTPLPISLTRLSKSFVWSLWLLALS